VAADCPLQSGQVTIADLANFPIITFRRQTKPYCQVKELFNSAGLNKIQMFAISSLSSIIRMTLDNIGIAAIPQAVAVEHLTSKQLRILDTGQAMPVMTFTASYVERTDSPLNAMVANLAREVAARFHSS
jgi:DNA-binding transcriptional LysR family regulator